MAAAFSLQKMKKYFFCVGVTFLLVVSPVSAKFSLTYKLRQNLYNASKILFISGIGGLGALAAWSVYDIAKNDPKVRDFFRGVQTKFRNLRQGPAKVHFTSGEIEFLGLGRPFGVANANANAPGPRVIPGSNVVPPPGYVWGRGFQLARWFPGVFGFLAYSEPLQPPGKQVSWYSTPPEIVQ